MHIVSSYIKNFEGIVGGEMLYDKNDRLPKSHIGKALNNTHAYNCRA